jgi:hypothetical protein
VEKKGGRKKERKKKEALYVWVYVCIGEKGRGPPPHKKRRRANIEGGKLEPRERLSVESRLEEEEEEEGKKKSPVERTDIWERRKEKGRREIHVCRVERERGEKKR